MADRIDHASIHRKDLKVLDYHTASHLHLLCCGPICICRVPKLLQGLEIQHFKGLLRQCSVPFLQHEHSTMSLVLHSLFSSGGQPIRFLTIYFIDAGYISNLDLFQESFCATYEEGLQMHKPCMFVSHCTDLIFGSVVHNVFIRALIQQNFRGLVAWTSA